MGARIFGEPYGSGEAVAGALVSTCAMVGSTNVTSIDPTLTDVDGMVFAVEAGKRYRFRFVALAQTDTVASAIGLSVSVPAFGAFAATAIMFTGADGGSARVQGRISASDDVVIGTAMPASGVDQLAELEGIITPSADGVVQFRACVEAASIARFSSGLGELWELTA